MTTAKEMDVMECDGQAADAASAWKVQMEDAPKLLKIPKSGCPDIWIRLPKHKWPKSWSSMEDPVVPLQRNLYGHSLAGLLWERQFEKVLLKHGWEKVSNWECLLVHREKGLSYLCMWMTSNWLENNNILIRCGKYLIINLIWENQHHPLIMFTWNALKDNVKQVEILWTMPEPCSNPKFPQEQRKNYQARKNWTCLRGPTI